MLYTISYCMLDKLIWKLVLSINKYDFKYNDAHVINNLFSRINTYFLLSMTPTKLFSLKNSTSVANNRSACLIFDCYKKR